MSRGGVLRGSKDCMGSTSTICGKTVKIIDTPGFFDGFTATEGNFQKLSKVVTLAKEGIHALAFVLGRYTDSCEGAIKQLLLFTGIQPFMFVLLTHAENLGKNEVTTKEYIEECLSSPDCPTGFRNLMKMVENRVIMLESVKFVANDYREQKSKEFIAMIENLREINENKIYSNSMLQLAAKVHEVAKQEQDAKIKEATELIALHSEKIKQLKHQTDDTFTTSSDSETSTASSDSETNNTIAALEEEIEEIRSQCSEIEDPRYIVEVTQKTLTEAMKNGDFGDKNFAEFAQSFAAYAAVSVAGTSACGGVYAGMGAIIGATVGSFFPVIGTAAGAYAGAQILGVLGGTAGFGAVTKSFLKTNTKGKAREGVIGVIDKAKLVIDGCKQN